MITLPLFVVAYGDFRISRKLFSYEKLGVPTMPIFTDGGLATKCAHQWSQMLRERFQDQRKLSVQICPDAKKASDMFTMISIYAPDIRSVVIDPDPPVTTLGEFRIIEERMELTEVIEALNAMAGITSPGSQEDSNSSSTSKTK